MKAPAILGLLIILTSTGGAVRSDQREDAVQYPNCALCSMSREKFSHSRGLVVWRGDTVTPVCSLNCAVAAIDAGGEKAVTAVFIADYDTRELLRAEKAHWVIGGSVKGVMTTKPKWAFASQEGADTFIRHFGGVPSSWEDAVEQARAGLFVRKKK